MMSQKGTTSGSKLLIDNNVVTDCTEVSAREAGADGTVEREAALRVHSRH